MCICMASKVGCLVCALFVTALMLALISRECCIECKGARAAALQHMCLVYAWCGCPDGQSSVQQRSARMHRTMLLLQLLLLTSCIAGTHTCAALLLLFAARVL